MEYLLLAVLIIVPFIIPKRIINGIVRWISNTRSSQGVNVKEIVEMIKNREKQNMYYHMHRNRQNYHPSL